LGRVGESWRGLFILARPLYAFATATSEWGDGFDG
jgi:hypothetical protein